VIGQPAALFEQRKQLVAGNQPSANDSESEQSVLLAFLMRVPKGTPIMTRNGSA
jgi:hypothetical protein